MQPRAGTSPRASAPPAGAPSLGAAAAAWASTRPEAIAPTFRARLRRIFRRLVVGSRSVEENRLRAGMPWFSDASIGLPLLYSVMGVRGEPATDDRSPYVAAAFALE